MEFTIPVHLTDYNGKSFVASMGPFEHSPEREFSLTVNKKAIQDCDDINNLKEVATNLLIGWSGMQTASQTLILENIQLRQALSQRDADLEAADGIIAEAAQMMEQSHEEIEKQYEKKSWHASWNLWPWRKSTEK